MLFNALLRITRFWNLLIIALAQYATAAFLIDKPLLPDAWLSMLMISTVLVAAGGYIINDYYDVKIDLINKPERVVIGNILSRRTALLLHTGLSTMGVLLGLVAGWKIGALNFVSAFLLWLYSNALKRQPLVGNITVAFLTGLSVLIVNILFLPPLVLVGVYSLFAFFMTLVREIIKDIEDLKGDLTFGCRTLPIVWGVRKTKQFIYFLLTGFIASVVGLHVSVAPLPVAYFTGFLFLPILWLMAWLIRADTRQDYRHLSLFCKIIMLAGIVSMAFV